MEKPIETIWKEAFSERDLKEVPRLGNFYDQESQQLVDKVKRKFKNNLVATVVMAIVILIVHMFIEAAWQGAIAAALLLGLAWYSTRQMRRVHTVNPGLGSYQYLRLFDQTLREALAKNMIVIRFFYPLIFLTSMSTIWYAGNNEAILTGKLTETFPDLLFVGGLPLIGLIAVGGITVLIAYFSGRIYKWDVGLIYGRTFKKLRETIADMEQLNE